MDPRMRATGAATSSSRATGAAASAARASPGANPNRCIRCLGFTYSLVVTDINRARLYKRLFSVLGYRYDIVRDLRIPAEAGFDGLPHLLGVGYHDAACFTGDAHAPLKAVA